MIVCALGTKMKLFAGLRFGQTLLTIELVYSDCQIVIPGIHDFFPISMSFVR